AANRPDSATGKDTPSDTAGRCRPTECRRRLRPSGDRPKGYLSPLNRWGYSRQDHIPWTDRQSASRPGTPPLCEGNYRRCRKLCGIGLRSANRRRRVPGLPGARDPTSGRGCGRTLSKARDQYGETATGSYGPNSTRRYKPIHQVVKAPTGVPDGPGTPSADGFERPCDGTNPLKYHQIDSQTGR